MGAELKKKALSGVVWGFFEKFSMQLFSFVQGIILARLLLPSDFGLIAMAGVFIAVSHILIDSGFSSALIRNNHRTNLDFSTVFVINVCMSSLMALLLYVSAPFIAVFYNEPLLLNIIRVNGLLIFLGSLISVQRVKMVAELRFRQKSLMSIVVSVVSGVTSIVLALLGFGVWSLIYPSFLSFLLNVCFFWYFQRWFPGIKFSMDSCKKHFGFGSKLLASSIINTIYGNLYPIVIGKKFSSTSLGYYSKASSYAGLPATTLTEVVGSVAYPILSEIQDDDDALIRAYRRMLRLSAFVLFPVMIGIASVSRPLILLMITEKWEPCIIYLQILCFSMMLYPIHALNLQLLKVKGRSDLFLRLEILKKILAICVLFISAPFGLVYMCIGSVISSYLCLGINTYYTGKLLSYGFVEQAKELLPTFFYSLSMGVLVYFCIQSFSSYYVQLLFGVSIGATYYYSLSRIIKSEDLYYLVEIIKNKMHK